MDADLLVLCGAPQPTRSESDWLRAEHADLPDLTDADLVREHARAIVGLARWTGPAAESWHLARMRAIEAERRRREAER